MSFLIFCLGLIFHLLAGILLLAIALRIKYGDRTACYGLFAVRDSIVSAVVFDGVPRDEPWLCKLYENVNTLLQISSAFIGPGEGWNLAARVGIRVAEVSRTPRARLPQSEIPASIRPIAGELSSALDFLLKNHMGWVMLHSNEARERRRQQRIMARELRESLRVQAHLV